LRFTADTPLDFIATCSSQPEDNSAATSYRPDLVARKTPKITSPPPFTRIPELPNADEGRGWTRRGHNLTDAPSTNVNPIAVHTAETNFTDTENRSPGTSASGNTTKPPSVAWVDLETVVTYYSQGKSVDDNIKQAVAYTGYLLAARPDRVAILGLHIGLEGFAVILVNPTRVYRTDQIPWNKPQTNTLLLRALYYLGDPPSSMTDPTIHRDDDGTFQITVGKNVHNRCQQLSYPALGRWTTVFKAPGCVLKLQYLRSADKISEGEILKNIHADGVVPGVVRIGWYDWVKHSDGANVGFPTENGRWQRVCLKLRDTGDPFMGIDTPYDALIVIWDLLEGGTLLHLSLRC
jgi:hypothetical protein